MMLWKALLLCYLVEVALSYSGENMEKALKVIVDEFLKDSDDDCKIISVNGFYMEQASSKQNVFFVNSSLGIESVDGFCAVLIYWSNDKSIYNYTRGKPIKC